jgi:hypothetical protein
MTDQRTEADCQDAYERGYARAQWDARHATPPAVDVERLRHVAEWVVREYDKTHLTHDVSYEKVAEAIDWLRIALDPKHPLYARLGDTR